MNNKVSILGTDYIIMCDTTKELIDKGLDGQVNVYNKIITIRNIQDMLDEDSSIYDKKLRYNDTLKHEIIHAFLFESGLENYCNDEILVDWISKQWNKMTTAFHECYNDEPLLYA